MRQLMFILTFFLTAGVCFSQTTIWGIYVNQDGAYTELDLKPDSTYNYHHQGRCGVVPAYNDTGIFTLIADTIFLKSSDTLRKQEKYLFISHLVSDNNSFSFWETGTIAQIFKSETILPRNQAARLSDYETLYFGSYSKIQGYYNDGKLTFKEENFDKSRVITNYYSTGQIKLIERYYNNQKTGDWYYFKENGQLEKIETYHRNKLKRKKKNHL